MQKIVTISTHKNLWEGTQKEKLNQGIIAKVEKSNKTKDVTKKLLQDCKSCGGPFTTVNELDYILHRRPESQESIIKTEIVLGPNQKKLGQCLILAKRALF